jgi:hypothetical protein
MIRTRLTAAARIRHGPQIFFDDDIGGSQRTPAPTGEPEPVDADQSFTFTKEGDGHA